MFKTKLAEVWYLRLLTFKLWFPLKCQWRWRTQTCDYNETSPLGHLYSRETSIQEAKTLVPENCWHILIFVFVTSTEGTPLFSGKGRFLWVPKPRFNLHSRDTLTLKKVPGHKIIAKCTLKSQWRQQVKRINYLSLIDVLHLWEFRRDNLIMLFFKYILSCCLK